MNNVHISYDCPYCGHTITKKNVLFANETNNTYIDLRKFCFLKLCANQWPLEGTDNKLYFKVTDSGEDGIVYDENHELPMSIKVRLDKGRTPAELEEENENDEDEDEHLKNYVAQYENRIGKLNISSQQDEIKLKDDGEEYVLGARVCPNCHCELDERFGQIPTYSTALIGGVAAGKTAYLVALANQITSQMNSHQIGTVNLLSPSQMYYKYLYSPASNTGDIAATPKEDSLFPFVFYFKNNQGKEGFVSFYDMAGEQIKKINGLIKQPGLERANSLLLMIDANQLNNGAFYKREMSSQKKHPETDVSADMPIDELNEIGAKGTCFNEQIIPFLDDVIKKLTSHQIVKNIKNIIFVMTKFDLPLTQEQNLLSKSILLNDIGTSHQQGVDLSVIREVNLEMDSYLACKSGMNPGQPYQMIKNKFSEINKNGKSSAAPNLTMLGVSVCTKNTDANGNVYFEKNWVDTAPKHRIIEPFLMILYLNELISRSDAVDPDPVNSGSDPNPDSPKRHWWQFWKKN